MYGVYEVRRFINCRREKDQVTHELFAVLMKAIMSSKNSVIVEDCLWQTGTSVIGSTPILATQDAPYKSGIRKK